jgi:hypothetical protein
VTKTKSSQKTNCDHSGVFNDVNVTSLMTTSLLVLPDEFKISNQIARLNGRLWLTSRADQ